MFVFLYTKNYMTNKVLALLIFLLLCFKITAAYFTNFGLYGDEAQYWVWSQVVDLGYYSKPPLLAWFLSLYTELFGSSFVSLKIFPIVIYFFISFAVYRLCTSLSFEKNSSWLCAASFLVVPAASLSSFLVSTDLLLLLFWTISMVVLLNTIKTNSTKNYLLLGLFLGLAFLAKYAAVYFLLSLLLLLITDKKTFNNFKNNPTGVFVFVLSFLLVLAPNIWWNFNNNWVTISHTSDNANLQNLNLSLYEPLKFLGSQIVMIGPLLFVFFVFLIKYLHLDFTNKFLLLFSLPVLIVVLIESFLVRANANWAAPALVSIFVLLFRVVSSKGAVLIKINFVFNYVVVLFLFYSILVSSDNRVFNRIKGVNSFVKEISGIVDDKDLVVSDRIVFSNISYQMRNETNKIYMPYKNNLPITNHFQISSPLKKDRGGDFFLIGNLDDVSYLSKKNTGILIKEFDVPFSSNKLKLYEINFK